MGKLQEKCSTYHHICTLQNVYVHRQREQLITWQSNRKAIVTMVCVCAAMYIFTMRYVKRIKACFVYPCTFLHMTQPPASQSNTNAQLPILRSSIAKESMKFCRFFSLCKNTTWPYHFRWLSMHMRNKSIQVNTIFTHQHIICQASLSSLLYLNGVRSLSMYLKRSHLYICRFVHLYRPRVVLSVYARL